MTSQQFDALMPVSEELFAQIEPILAAFTKKCFDRGIHRGQWPGMNAFKIDGMSEEDQKTFDDAAKAWSDARRPMCLVAAEAYEGLVLVHDCGHGYAFLVDLVQKTVQCSSLPGFSFATRNLVVIDKFQYDPPLKSSFFVSTHLPAAEAFVEEWRPARDDSEPSGIVASVPSQIH